MSLTCALGATLFQRWARGYLARVRGTWPNSGRHNQVKDHSELARSRTAAFQSLLRFHVPDAIDAINMLLHISLFLFFTGLVEFVAPLNRGPCIHNVRRARVRGVDGPSDGVLSLPLPHTPVLPFRVWYRVYGLLFKFKHAVWGASRST
ncbi:hypothetical protein FA95DRAFT_556121, partial [Auriscalpium vulgare]